MTSEPRTFRKIMEEQGMWPPGLGDDEPDVAKLKNGTYEALGGGGEIILLKNATTKGEDVVSVVEDAARRLADDQKIPLAVARERLLSRSRELRQRYNAEVRAADADRMTAQKREPQAKPAVPAGPVSAQVEAAAAQIVAKSGVSKAKAVAQVLAKDGDLKVRYYREHREGKRE